MKLKTNFFAFFLICLLSITTTNAQEAMLGEVKMFAGSFAPRGWVFCDGQLMDISQNTALYSLLGTIYGGDGRTTFGIPDLRGRVPMGVGNGPGLTTKNQGLKIGDENATLTVLNLPAHSHVASITNATTTDTQILLSKDNAVRQIPQVGDVSAAANYPVNTLSKQPVKSFGPPTNTVVSKTITSSSTINVGNTGMNKQFSITQPSITIRFIICTMGIYPSRN
ncbi:phage tail protein [Tenacibaculum aestuariivivum]|uniref:phage tail protein n=1 Tax=Tenacibaculum aestuariivivum TaxID=2006131 RepID=UPI003AB40A35